MIGQIKTMVMLFVLLFIMTDACGSLSHPRIIVSGTKSFIEAEIQSYTISTVFEKNMV